MVAEAGDRVKIICQDSIIEGVLIQRPSLLPQDFIVIKLDNGYNIGVDKKKIKRIEVLEKYKPKKTKKKIKLKFNKKLPIVTILSTGGTISSKVDYTTGGVSAYFTSEDLVAMCPELKEIANIRTRKIMSAMSEDIMPKDWIKIAEETFKELKKCDGVVITTGTDTMHYIAAALSFMIQKPNKPIIITGAQRSIDRGSSDAFMNLICAVQAAAKFDGAEVMTCMHGTINDDYCLLIRGTKVRKMHASRRDAFRPVNDNAIAKINIKGEVEVLTTNYNRRYSIEKDNKNKAPVLDTKINEKVALVLVYPGMEPGIIDYHINKGAKGIVISATALGHVPTNNTKTLIPAIERAIKKNIPVVIASQTIYGRVHPYVYTNLRKLSIELKSIFVEDMLPEVAYIKLMYALAHAKNLEDIKSLMLLNIAGEITDRETPDTFLK
ncbi:MAG: Glu-tRNA(Gln) amidotransferase subunit GatD [Candidatus Woesearchaeota archaeon]